MKSILVGMLLVLGINHSAFSQAPGVAWDISLTEEGFVAQVYNSNELNLICNVSYSASVLDESGLVKGMKKISFDNYYLQARKSYTFEILKKNFPQADKFHFGEIIRTEEPLRCALPGILDVAYKNALEGALRNSDLETALLFKEQMFNPFPGIGRNPYATNGDFIKTLDVSNSIFNLPNAAAELNFNHIEADKTTLTMSEAKDGSGECKERKSMKCGSTILSARSASCGVEEYYPKGSTFPCGSATCTRRVAVPKTYKECVHSSHGIGDAQSCLLKINSNGAYETCQL